MCPYLSFDNALKYSKGKIDYVVISSPTKDDILNDQLEVYIKKTLDVKIVLLCDHHHLSHASLAFYNSGFDKSLTVVIDRNGSRFDRLRESESIFISEYPHHFKPIYKSYWLEKIGIYEDNLNYEKIKEIHEKFYEKKIDGLVVEKSKEYFYSPAEMLNH